MFVFAITNGFLGQGFWCVVAGPAIGLAVIAVCMISGFMPPKPPNRR